MENKEEPTRQELLRYGRLFRELEYAEAQIRLATYTFSKKDFDMAIRLLNETLSEMKPILIKLPHSMSIGWILSLKNGDEKYGDEK